MSALIILQWMGRVLLILLAIILVLLLLVLFVPIRYQVQFRIEDPEPHEAAEWERIGKSAAGTAVISWMGPLLRLHMTYPGEPMLELRVLFWHRDLMSLLPHKAQEEMPGQSDDKKQTPICDKIKRIWRKADYYKRVLQKEETGYTIGRLKEILFGTLRRILPQKWQLTADVGLGDPAATAKVLEVQGMLYPLIAGHVCIHPEFMQYQLNGEGSCKGGIRLVHLVIAALQVVMDRKVMLTLRRLRNADRNIEAHYERSAVNGG